MKEQAIRTERATISRNNPKDVFPVWLQGQYPYKGQEWILVKTGTDTFKFVKENKEQPASIVSKGGGITGKGNSEGHNQCFDKNFRVMSISWKVYADTGLPINPEEGNKKLIIEEWAKNHPACLWNGKMDKGKKGEFNKTTEINFDVGILSEAINTDYEHAEKIRVAHIALWKLDAKELVRIMYLFGERPAERTQKQLSMYLDGDGKN